MLSTRFRLKNARKQMQGIEDLADQVDLEELVHHQYVKAEENNPKQYS
jgi:hypothetical protein